MRIALAIALLATAPAAAQQQAEYSESATDGIISGTVQNTRGEPISGAWVVIQGNTRGESRQRISRHAATNAAGQVRFDSLPNGGYHPSIQHAGHTVGRRQQQNIELLGDEARASFTLVAQRAPVITGQVFDEAGAPMFRARVQLFRDTVVDGRPTLQMDHSASTDDRGIYRLTTSNPGRYVLMATHTEAAFPRGSAPRSTGLTFFPNSPDLSAAARLDLAFDQPEQRFDITLLPAPATGLGVSVFTGPNARACRNCRYSLRRADGPYVYEIATGATSRSPGFTYGGVPAGAYRILVADYQMHEGWWAVAETTLVEGRATQFEVVTQPPVLLSGRVAVEAPAEDLFRREPDQEWDPIRVHANMDDNRGFFGQGPEITWQQGITEDRQEFALGPFPPLRVRPQVSITGGNGYLAAIQRQGRPIPSPVLDLSQPGPWTNLELVVRFDPAQPAVVITTGAGTSLRPRVYRVLLAPVREANPFGIPANSTCAGPERCDLAPAPPGEYRLVALPQDAPHDFDLNNPQTLERLAPWIRNATLTPGENPPIPLSVAPAELPPSP